jgi:hypothetical protein
LQHGFAQIQPDEPYLWESLQHPGRKLASAAADIQDSEIGRPDLLENPSMGRLEKQPLERIAVVAPAPAGEFSLRF